MSSLGDTVSDIRLQGPREARAREAAEPVCFPSLTRISKRAQMTLGRVDHSPPRENSFWHSVITVTGSLLKALWNKASEPRLRLKHFPRERTIRETLQ